MIVQGPTRSLQRFGFEFECKELMPSESELSDVLSEFARTMLMEPKIQGILDQLVRRAADVLPISAAGVTLSWNDGEPELIAGSDESALNFELLQNILGEGPRFLSYETGESVSVPDLAMDDRFAEFHHRTVGEGLGAMFTFPLRDGRDLVGSLDLYRDSPGTLDATAARAAQTLADVAAAYLTNARSRADLQEASARARQRSLHDGLTGLPNRALLLERLEHAFLRGRRSRNLTAILFCDLDKFKRVNDVFGHRVGDELLIAVAERLTKQLRPGDTLARLSGDEFVLVLEDVSEAEVQVIADRIDAAFSEPFPLSCGEIRTKASIGIAFAGRGNERPVKVLEKADLAMYQAKRGGGGRHHVIGHGQQSVLQRRGEARPGLRS
jgi:diguanylate cyclase (GGDEF)-like protein